MQESQTDWARLDAMADEDIDLLDIPEITEEMWAKAVWRKGSKPIPTKSQENLPVDCDIIEFFKAQDFNYPAKINQLLRDIWKRSKRNNFMKRNSRQILLAPFFLLGLFLLLLNDFVLKSQFHNFFTGKLSDFAGLFIFPLFFAAFFPKRKLFIFASTIFLFVFWKSTWSQSSIDLWNSLRLFRIGRTIDDTDLFALSVLPPSYFYFKAQTQNTFSLNSAKRITASLVVLLSVFAFTATSTVDDRSVSLVGEYRFKINKDKIENILKQNEKITGLTIRRETDVYPPANYPDVKTDPKAFFANFSLKQKICDSEFPSFSFSIHQEKDFTTVEGLFVHFNCREESMKPDGNTRMQLFEQEVSAIFEREVIEKLRQNESR